MIFCFFITENFDDIPKSCPFWVLTDGSVNANDTKIQCLWLLLVSHIFWHGLSYSLSWVGLNQCYVAAEFQDFLGWGHGWTSNHTNHHLHKTVCVLSSKKFLILETPTVKSILNKPKHFLLTKTCTQTATMDKYLMSVGPIYIWQVRGRGRIGGGAFDDSGYLNLSLWLLWAPGYTTIIE